MKETRAGKYGRNLAILLNQFLESESYTYRKDD